MVLLRNYLYKYQEQQYQYKNLLDNISKVQLDFDPVNKPKEDYVIEGSDSCSL